MTFGPLRQDDYKGASKRRSESPSAELNSPEVVAPVQPFVCKVGRRRWRAQDPDEPFFLGRNRRSVRHPYMHEHRQQTALGQGPKRTLSERIVAPLNRTDFLQMTPGGWDSPEIRCAWEASLASSNDPRSLKKSPRFFDYLRQTRGDGAVALLTARDDTGSVVAVVPLLLGRVGFRFDVAGHILAKFSLSGVTVLGSLPQLPRELFPYDGLFDAISRQFSGCGIVRIESVPTESPFWRYLQHSRYLRKSFFIHVPDGIQQCHTIPLPATFEEYLGQLKAKKRYNIKRQIRLLKTSGAGQLELQRIESRDQIPKFDNQVSIVQQASRVRGISQPYWAPSLVRANLEALADRGLLLSYVLSCGDSPCAAAFGMIHERCYYLESLIRDPSFDRFSPGTSLVHLVAEDLISSQSADLIDLGFGEPAYKHSSTNVTQGRSTVFLLRKTLPNRMRFCSHAVFKWSVARVKRALHRGGPLWPVG